MEPCKWCGKPTEEQFCNVMCEDAYNKNVYDSWNNYCLSEIERAGEWEKEPE